MARWGVKRHSISACCHLATVGKMSSTSSTTWTLTTSLVQGSSSNVRREVIVCSQSENIVSVRRLHGMFTRWRHWLVTNNFCEQWNKGFASLLSATVIHLRRALCRRMKRVSDSEQFYKTRDVSLQRSAWNETQFNYRWESTGESIQVSLQQICADRKDNRKSRWKKRREDKNPTDTFLNIEWHLSIYCSSNTSNIIY